MRKGWDSAFKGNALEGYAERLKGHIDRCVETTLQKVDVEKGTAQREAKKMCAGLTFDFMTDLTFGIPNYGMLDETGDSEYMVSGRAF